jgi:hypothetical protein
VVGRGRVSCGILGWWLHYFDANPPHHVIDDQSPVFLTPSADGVCSAAGSSLCAPWRSPPSGSAPPRPVSVSGNCSLVPYELTRDSL